MGWYRIGRGPRLCCNSRPFDMGRVVFIRITNWMSSCPLPYSRVVGLMYTLRQREAKNEHQRTTYLQMMVVEFIVADDVRLLHGILFITGLAE